MSRDRSLSVTLRGNVAPYVAAIRQAGTATRDFAAQAGASARQNRADWEQVGRTVTVAGLAMAAGLGVGVKQVMDFEAAMSGASAATKATATDLGKSVSYTHLARADSPSTGATGLADCRGPVTARRAARASAATPSVTGVPPELRSRLLPLSLIHI